MCPAVVRGVRGIEADWARRIAEELDREPDDPRYVRLAVVGLGVDMRSDAVQRLLGHERLVALAWPRREDAPVRTILMFGAPDPEDEDCIRFGAVDLDDVVDAWSQYCAVASVTNSAAPMGPMG